ncbi:MAG: hypothetical protein GX444_09565 [Myxococcales bacterium]|nr:hypothetical protein [Myxococcales bacterium]
MDSASTTVDRSAGFAGRGILGRITQEKAIRSFSDPAAAHGIIAVIFRLPRFDNPGS